MRTTIVVLALLFCNLISMAVEPLIDDTSGIVYVPENQWRSLTPLEMEAYKNPGENIPVWTSRKWGKRGVLYGVLIREASGMIIYSNGRITLIPEEIVKVNKQLLIHKIFLLLSLFSIAMGNVIFWVLDEESGERYRRSAVFSWFATVFMLGASTFAFRTEPFGLPEQTNFLISCGILTVTFAIFLNALSTAISSKDIYIPTSIICYIGILTSI